MGDRRAKRGPTSYTEIVKRFTTGGRMLRPSASAWLFLVAYLPSVLFVGHFSVPAFDVPGVGTVAIPLLSSPRSHEHTGAVETHAAHCHGEQECADSSQGATQSPVDFLGNDLLILLGSALFVAVAVRGTVLYRDWPLLPAPPPPRFA
jgi:hypothetical protein